MQSEGLLSADDAAGLQRTLRPADDGGAGDRLRRLAAGEDPSSVYGRKSWVAAPVQLTLAPAAPTHGRFPFSPLRRVFGLLQAALDLRRPRNVDALLKSIGLRSSRPPPVMSCFDAHALPHVSALAARASIWRVTS